MSLKSNDIVAEDFKDWLDEQGRTIGDVMQDDNGDCYILAEGEEDLEKVYLPRDIQAYYLAIS